MRGLLQADSEMSSRISRILSPSVKKGLLTENSPEGRQRLDEETIWPTLR